MAQPSLEKWVTRGLALALQSAEDTPATPSATTDGFRLYDGSSGTEVDTAKNNADRPYFAGASITTFNERAFIEGAFHLYPPSVPGDAVNGQPECHNVLLPGGMTRVLNLAARTTRYNPISTGVPFSTAYWWHAGMLLKVYNARHALSGLSLEIGKRFEGKVRIQGTYDSITEQTLPSITVTENDGPVVEAGNGQATITVLPSGTPLTVWGKSLSLDFGSSMKSKEYTGKKTTTIDGRDAKWTMRCARTALSDFNPDALRRTDSYLTASLRVKGSDGRYATLGIRGQIESWKPVEIDGDLGWELSGPCVASTAGGDEFYIEFGDVSLKLNGTLSPGTRTVAYSGTTSLTAVGEFTAPLTWSISAGTLPAGLTINASTGVISGTPTTAATSAFTVRAVDAAGQAATSAQSVTVT